MLNSGKALTDGWNGIERVKGDTRWLKDIYQQVFFNYDPYNPLANDRLERYTVLFPIDSYHLTRTQYDALVKAIGSIEDKRFYISEIGWEEKSFEKGVHYFCHEPTFDLYTSLPIGVENAIYGVRGDWGLLISDELHGILVCSRAFFEAFRRYYPRQREDLSAFRRYWLDISGSGTKIDWLDPLCSRLSD